ncbi:MAG TPA: TonB-dependent receptor plug domain-containing protein, partial [Brevundimonas diminuta]|nr:TonB-dependent receptor plug domain-containing protein [Brevundimonas diminuta]
MICRGRRGFILFGIAFSLGGQTAQAGERHRLSIPAQPMTAAVLQLGVQARVSINAGAAACGRSRAVRGSHDVQSALRLMTEGSACAFRRIDDRTYIITPRPQPRPASSPRTAPEAPPVEHVPFAVDDVIVTATKRDLALADAPYALSALDGDVFDAAARQDTAALATRLAGLTVTNLGSGRNKLFVRGLADSPLTGQTQAMVGLYLDETRLTYDAPDPDLRLVDLERVELLRGPQASLYGAGAMGGVLKLVSRPPELDAYSGKASAGVSFTEGSISGNSTDVIFNAPLIRDRLAMRTVIYQERFGGVIDDTNLGLIDTGRTVRSGTRMTFLWRIDPQWQARLGWVRQDIRINDSQYAFESQGTYERALSKREPSNNNFSGMALAVTGDLSWGRVKITNAFQAHNLGRRYDATRAAASLGASDGPLIYDEADSIEAIALEMSVATHPG